MNGLLLKTEFFYGLQNTIYTIKIHNIIVV